MNLKIGGSNVGKIMYGGQEFGNQKLEPGMILYLTEGLKGATTFKGVRLKSATKDWSNIDGIHIQAYYDNLNGKPIDDLIYSDDFKSLDKGKEYNISKSTSITVSRSIIYGEYRLNCSSSGYALIFVIEAI